MTILAQHGWWQDQATIELIGIDNQTIDLGLMAVSPRAHDQALVTLPHLRECSYKPDHADVGNGNVDRHQFLLLESSLAGAVMET